MHNQYTLYAFKNNGSRNVLRIDDDYLKVLLPFVNGTTINHEVIKIVDILTVEELEFLSKVTSGECDYFLLTSKYSKIIRRIEAKIYFEM